MKYRDMAKGVFSSREETPQSRIMLIGKETTDLEALKKCLPPNYAIEVVEWAASSKRGKRQYDLIILAGCSLISQLPALSKALTYYPPVIFHGSAISAKERIKARRLGVISFVVSSPEEQELVAAIENVIQYTRVQSQPAKKNTLFCQEVTKALGQLLSDQPGFGVKDLGQKLQLSQSTVYRKIKEAFDQSPNRLIAAYRCYEAAKLLSGSDQNITEIAYTCGFSSSTYLARTFKQFYGITPRQFRKDGLSSAQFVRIFE
ncbi:MAG: helix-turn-helix transcriptional regulator [Phaeodactylibacter sp.]|uniref:helix-turn-helix domain-containing protein n=1 Tax=Phaeodactylibacter sp. TaxID=1940289 RepID=UPI0032EC5500